MFDASLIVTVGGVRAHGEADLASFLWGQVNDLLLPLDAWSS